MRHRLFKGKTKADMMREVLAINPQASFADVEEVYRKNGCTDKVHKTNFYKVRRSVLKQQVHLNSPGELHTQVIPGSKVTLTEPVEPQEVTTALAKFCREHNLSIKTLESVVDRLKGLQVWNDV